MDMVVTVGHELECLTCRWQQLFSQLYKVNVFKDSTHANAVPKSKGSSQSLLARDVIVAKNPTNASC